MSTTVTALYAGLFGSLFVCLSAWVVAGRLRGAVLHGDGGVASLNRRIRAHGNFAEYVPLALLLAALLEGRGVASEWLHGLLAPLLVARLAHPFGMLAPVGSMRQYLLRGAPTLATWVVIATASILLIRS